MRVLTVGVHKQRPRNRAGVPAYESESPKINLAGKWITEDAGMVPGERVFVTVEGGAIVIRKAV